MTTAIEPPRRRWTTDEYHKMAELGILGEDERLELIDGEVIELAPRFERCRRGEMSQRESASLRRIRAGCRQRRLRREAACRSRAWRMAGFRFQGSWLRAAGHCRQLRSVRRPVLPGWDTADWRRTDSRSPAVPLKEQAERPWDSFRSEALPTRRIRQGIGAAARRCRKDAPRRVARDSPHRGGQAGPGVLRLPAEAAMTQAAAVPTCRVVPHGILRTRSLRAYRPGYMFRPRPAAPADPVPREWPAWTAAMRGVSSSSMHSPKCPSAARPKPRQWR